MGRSSERRKDVYKRQVYVIAAAVLYYRQRPQVINELITFATEYGQVQKLSLIHICDSFRDPWNYHIKFFDSYEFAGSHV